MKITAALAVLITFSVSAKLCGAASAPPQDDSDYIGGSGDHAGDPRHGGPTLSPPHPGAPAEGEGALLPPADYDDEDYADYGSGDYLDYEDHGGSSSPVTPDPTTSTTTTTQPTTTTTTQPTTTTTTTTTTTPPPDVLAENGIYGTEEADYNPEDDDEYYDENYYDSYDDEDYGEEGSGGAAGGDYHDPGTGTHDGHHESTGAGDRDYDTGDRDDDLWEDDFTDHGTHGTADHAEEVEPRHDIEDPIVFEGTGVEAESAPVDPPHDSDAQPSPDQEVWVPKVGVVPEAVTPAQDGADQGSEMDGSVQIVTHKEHERHVSVFAQPGMLAAFIGGAVVGLLCAILLVMFVVYRMRKKDEGSYPLDEPKRVPLTSSYASSGKEIYA